MMSNEAVKKEHVPTLGGSTYVNPDRMEWNKTRFDKVSIKVLYENKERGEMTCLLKLDPGAVIPFHLHPDTEQSYVLDGSVEDHDGRATVGQFIWRKPGSKHGNTSVDGALLLAIYRKPNIYFHLKESAEGFASNGAQS
jgi:quercetin dioxygenase-like cupin family protein